MTKIAQSISTISVSIDTEHAGCVRIEAVTPADLEAALYLIEQTARRRFNCHTSAQGHRTVRVASVDLPFELVHAAVADDARLAEVSAEVQHVWDKQIAQEQVLKGPAPAFCIAVIAASGGKLCLTFGQPTCFSAQELMPVTHFKALARATSYCGRTRTFDLARSTPSQRAKALETAEKLSRSTKKTTREDIAARRKVRAAAKANATGNLHMDYAEAMEDFGKEQADEWLSQGRLLVDRETVAPY